MSSYMVEDACINLILGYARTRAEQGRHIPGLRSLGFDLTRSEDVDRLGCAMFALNIAGVDARYGSGQAKELRPLDYTPAEVLLVDGKAPTLAQVEDAVREWLYQCSEGDVPSEDLFRVFQALRPVVRSEAQAEAARFAQLAQTAKASCDDEDEARGVEWLSKNRPAWAKAVIVAHAAVDESDSQTDYFHVRDGEPVILAWSTHTRDIFTELRKACKDSRLSTVAHFVTPPTEDRNGCAHTEANRGWWHPSDEHREKYSMGAGYYLRAGHGGGWTVEKWTLADWRMRQIAIAIGRGMHTLETI